MSGGHARPLVFLLYHIGRKLEKSRLGNVADKDGEKRKMGRHQTSDGKCQNALKR